MPAAVDTPSPRRLLAAEPDDVVVRAPVPDHFASLLSPGALSFLVELHRRFDRRRREALHHRSLVQREVDFGLAPTLEAAVGEASQPGWHAPAAPPDLRDVRVELVGAPDRASLEVGLVSGAGVFVADFDGMMSPRWAPLLDAQRALACAARGALIGRDGRAADRPARTATLVVGPRSWHLNERHVSVDEQPLSAALFDFGLFAVHSARVLVDRGSGPYLQLTRLRGPLEARLWADVLTFTERRLGLPEGTIRVSVRVDHVLAALGLEDILGALHTRVVAVACAECEYVASLATTFRNHSDLLLPDANQITAERRFYRSYVGLVTRTAHRHGLPAVAAVYRGRPAADPVSHRLVRQRARREAVRAITAGLDRVAVAHPALVADVDAMTKVFGHLRQTGDGSGDEAPWSADDLLAVPRGGVSSSGVRSAVRVALAYLAGWLGGAGTVQLDWEALDAGSAELARAQLWQWATYAARLTDGGTVTPALVRDVIVEELGRLPEAVREPRVDPSALGLAAKLLCHMVTREALREPVTAMAYEYLR